MGDDVLLLERLLSWRKSQVDVLKIPIYLIGNTEMFRTIAEKKPASFIQLQQIKGMGQAKVAKYGKDILDIVREYCEEFDIQQNEEIDFEEDVQKLIKKSNKTTRQVSESVVAKPKKPLHYSQYSTLDLWNQYKNIEKVAELRGLTKGTIESHIAFLSKEGKIKYEEWIDPRMIHQITAVVLQHADKNLTELKLLLPEDITFTQIRGVKDLIELKNVKSTEDEY
ncbi:MAG: helix-turn-helix domain-containing protein [Bacteroidetes bacterium]|nr:helix-turn-helix domain-containing protein [Bacteroidota bacterium]